MGSLDKLKRAQQDFDEKCIEKSKEEYKIEFSKLSTEELEEKLKSLNEEMRFMGILMKNFDSWESAKSSIWVGGLNAGRQHARAGAREREAQRRALREVLEERKWAILRQTTPAYNTYFWLII